MTLHELFAKHQIRRPIDLAHKAKLSRAYAHLIWTGKRHVSRKMARKIEANAGIPYAELMAAIPPNELAEVDEAVPGTPRARKPKDT